MKKLYLIDYSYYSYKYGYGYKIYNEVERNIFFGYVRLMKAINKREGGDVDRYEVGIVCDSKVSFRKVIYPFYKGNRETGIMVYGSFEIMNNFFSNLKNVEVYQSEGYEADDVIYSIVTDRAGEYEKIYICSIDSDLNVLLKYKNVERIISIYEDKYYTIEDYKREYGELEIEKFIFWKSIKGDKSDNIKGYKKVPKKFITMVSRECSDPMEILKMDKDRIKGYEKVIEEIQRNPGVLRLAYRLTKLNYCKYKKINKVEKTMDEVCSYFGVSNEISEKMIKERGEEECL